MTIRFRDLSVDDPGLREELLAAVDRVLKGGQLILGPEVEEFEQQVAAYCGKKFAVGVNSGTDALYLALRCLNVGPGDEVITTPLSWIATLNAIVLCGATPRFVDIGADLNIDPELIPAAITERTKVILPVHFTGRLCRMDRIVEIAGQHGLTVVEDAAQAFGAHRHGALAGSFGLVNCFSMNPMKVFCSYGEAGALVTDSAELAEQLRSLRYAGTVNKEDCHQPSLNGRIDTIQAAMMLVNLRHLPARISRLRQIAAHYTASLADVVACPKEDDTFQVYYSYTIVTERRVELIDFLRARGIETKIQHPILMPHHTAYRQRFAELRLPNAERLVARIVCIPCHEKLSDAEVDSVVQAIKEFFKRG